TKLICVFAAAAVLSLSGCTSGNGGTTAGTGSEPEQTTAETAAEKPEWNDLGQEEITAAMGMGWNLGNQLEASNSGIPSETAWGNPVITEELIKTVKEQGFKTVRIPVSYLLKIGGAPDYKIDGEWLNRIQEVVDYVINNDLYAVMNMHGDGYYTVEKSWLLCVDENQDEIKDKYEKVWTQIAERFKDYDEHLIFESMNEEFDNTYGKPNAAGYENINAYNQIFVDTVRKTGSNNAKRWLLLPGWNTNIEYTAGNYGFVIPTDSNCTADGNRLMISVHYYDPYNFTLDENMTSAKTQWGKYAVENFDNWGQEDYVDSTMKKLNDVFVSKGYPVIIGEMGVQNKQHVSDTFGVFRCYWMEYVVKAAKENGCIPIYWDNGWNGDKGFGVIDRNTREITEPDLIAAMMNAMNSDGDYEIAAPAGFEK
ncbi:MAG: glycoside hydrolase family 5 protein, partial [Muribaculaceae bacterium]|nr:glycoside hydrolase family 5 protein [Muribaculaceae bacterium]